MTRRMAKQDMDADAIADWKFAALVVDHLCFLVFSLFIFFSTILIIVYPYLRHRPDFVIAEEK